MWAEILLKRALSSIRCRSGIQNIQATNPDIAVAIDISFLDISVYILSQTDTDTRANTALSNLVATHRFVKEGRKGVWRREEAVFESSSRVGVSTQTQSYIFLFPFKSAATVTYLTNSSREIDREIRRLRHGVFKKNNCI